MQTHSTISPGAYLQQCREAAGLGIRQAAASLAALPWAVRRAGASDVTRMALRLNAAEADLHPFTRHQAELVEAVFDFDAELYVALQAVPIACTGMALQGAAA